VENLKFDHRATHPKKKKKTLEKRGVCLVFKSYYTRKTPLSKRENNVANPPTLCLCAFLAWLITTGSFFFVSLIDSDTGRAETQMDEDTSEFQDLEEHNAADTELGDIKNFNVRNEAEALPVSPRTAPMSEDVSEAARLLSTLVTAHKSLKGVESVPKFCEILSENASGKDSDLLTLFTCMKVLEATRDLKTLKA
jgi:hypothetical protein